MKINKYIAFDIDGTVFSSENILFSAYEIAVDSFNKRAEKQIAVPTEKAIFDLIGKPSKEIYKELFHSFNNDDIDFFAEKVRTTLVELIYEGKGIYYENIVEIIREIHALGYTVVAASNGSSPYITAVLKYAKLEDVFDIDNMIVIDKEIGIATKGDILAAYQKKYNYKSNNCIMIGDRTSDIDAAKFIGCPFIGTMYGHGELHEIEDADAILYSTADLLGTIAKIYE